MLQVLKQKKWKTFPHTRKSQNYMYNESNIHNILLEIPPPNKYCKHNFEYILSFLCKATYTCICYWSSVKPNEELKNISYLIVLSSIQFLSIPLPPLSHHPSSSVSLPWLSLRGVPTHLFCHPPSMCLLPQVMNMTLSDTTLLSNMIWVYSRHKHDWVGGWEMTYGKRGN